MKKAAMLFDGHTFHRNYNFQFQASFSKDKYVSAFKSREAVATEQSLYLIT